MGFFKFRNKKADFNLSASFSYFVPGWVNLLIMAALFFVGVLLASFVIQGVILLLALSSGADSAQVFASLGSYATLISYPLMFVPCLVYALSMGRHNALFGRGVAIDSSHCGRYGFVPLTLACSLATIAAGYVMDPVTSLLPEMDPALKAQLEMMTGDENLLANILCVCLLAPLCEEWLCRGIFLRGLLKMGVANGRKGVHPVLAIPLSSVLFALIHGNIWQGVPAFAIGCLFGLVYWRTGSLKLTMLMHCVNNTFSLILNQLEGLENMDSWAELLTPVQYWGIAAVSVALLAVFMVLLFRIPMQDRSGNLDVLEPVEV